MGVEIEIKKKVRMIDRGTGSGDLDSQGWTTIYMKEMKKESDYQEEDLCDDENAEGDIDESVPALE